MHQDLIRGNFVTDFLKRMQAITLARGSAFAVITFPEREEFARNDIPELFSLSQIFGPDTRLIAVPGAKLFPGVSKERIRHFYYDGIHINGNGAAVFDQATLPAIFRAYQESVQ